MLLRTILHYLILIMLIIPLAIMHILLNIFKLAC